MRDVFTNPELSTYAHKDRRCSVCCPVTLNICVKGFATMVCFICMISYHEPILNILAVSITGRLSITVDVKMTHSHLCGSEPRDFSITFEESISYLRYDYYPLASISFYRTIH